MWLPLKSWVNTVQSNKFLLVMPRIDYHFLKLANGINLYIFALTQHNEMNKEYEISCNLTDKIYLIVFKMPHYDSNPTQFSYP